MAQHSNRHENRFEMASLGIYLSCHNLVHRFTVPLVQLPINTPSPSSSSSQSSPAPSSGADAGAAATLASLVEQCEVIIGPARTDAGTEECFQ